MYFNEAYTNGDSGSDSEQLNGPSNKPDSKSLMSAIVSAIKSAPTNWHKGKIDKNHSGKNRILLLFSNFNLRITEFFFFFFRIFQPTRIH